MNKILLFYFFITFNHFAFAQNFQWAKSITGKSQNYSVSSIEDNGGNIITAGVFQDSADFDPGSATHFLASYPWINLYITKFSPNGNLIWAICPRSLNNGYCRPNAMALDADGNIVVTGELYGSVDLDPDTGTTILTSVITAQDIFIAKYDSSGHLVWAKSMGTNGSEYGNAIATDKQGNVVVTGPFGATLDFDPDTGVFNLVTAGSYDIFILKLDSKGKFIWAQRLGGTSDDYSKSIAVDEKGNIYTTGYFNGTADFNPDTSIYNLVAGAKFCVFISKLDSSGNFIWAKKLGGNDDNWGYSMAIQDSGYIYITGDFRGTTDFNPDTSSTYFLTSAGSSDFFIVKLDSSGKFVWAKRIGNTLSNYCHSITTDLMNNIYLTGWFTGTIDFDPGAGTYNLTSAGNTDIFVVKISAFGNFSWAMRIGDADYDNGASIKINNSSNIIITGNFIGAVDFDPGNGNTYLNNPTFNPNTFILKLCMPPNTVPGINGNAYFCEGSTKTYSVNPQKTITDYYWTVPPDAILVSGQNTISIVVQFGNNGGFITVTPGNGCSTAATTNKLVIPMTFTPGIKISPSQIVCAGTLVTLSGSGASLYSWSGGIIDGQAFTPLITSTYYLTATSINGCIKMDSVTITVMKLPVITKQPISKTINATNDSYFAVTSSDTLVTYQWQLNPGNGYVNLANSAFYSGVNSDTLKLYSVLRTQDNSLFRCIVSNGLCSDTSAVAKLQVNCNLKFTQQPVNKTVTPGASVLFVTVANSSTALLQWQMDTGSGFVNISNSGIYSGANKDSLFINGTTLGFNNYHYRCFITENGCSDTSNAVLLKVNCNLFITTQPLNQTVKVDSIVQFIIGASGNSSTYQWQENAGTGFINLSNSAIYSGVNDDTLTIRNISKSYNAYEYRCIIAELGCSDTSFKAILSVKSTGINQYVKENLFYIYPNPANNFITIQSDYIFAETPYLITDASGREVIKGTLHQPKIEIEISSLPKGFYLINIGEDKVENFKLMKQ